MGTKLSRSDFRRQYPAVYQGLFVFSDAKRLPKDQPVINLGYVLSERLMGIPADRVVKAISHLASSAGVAGMIGGQVIDMADNTDSDDNVLFEMYRLKTGALLKTACAIGCILAGADDQLIETAETFGEKVGVAFQIIDDILDGTSDTKTLGKTAGSDEKNNKDTIVVRLGVEYCRELAKKYTDEAYECLEKFDGDSTVLKQLAAYLLERNY